MSKRIICSTDRPNFIETEQLDCTKCLPKELTDLIFAELSIPEKYVMGFVNKKFKVLSDRFMSSMHAEDGTLKKEFVPITHDNCCGEDDHESCIVRFNLTEHLLGSEYLKILNWFVPYGHPPTIETLKQYCFSLDADMVVWCRGFFEKINWSDNKIFKVFRIFYSAFSDSDFSRFLEAFLDASAIPLVWSLNLRSLFANGKLMWINDYMRELHPDLFPDLEGTTPEAVSKSLLLSVCFYRASNEELKLLDLELDILDEFSAEIEYVHQKWNLLSYHIEKYLDVYRIVSCCDDLPSERMLLYHRIMINFYVRHEFLPTSGASPLASAIVDAVDMNVVRELLDSGDTYKFTPDRVPVAPSEILKVCKMSEALEDHATYVPLDFFTRHSCADAVRKLFI